MRRERRKDKKGAIESVREKKKEVEMEKGEIENNGGKDK